MECGHSILYWHKKAQQLLFKLKNISIYFNQTTKYIYLDMSSRKCLGAEEMHLVPLDVGHRHKKSDTVPTPEVRIADL